MPESYTVYGRRQFTKDPDNNGPRPWSKSLTQEGFTTMADAILALMDVVLKYGPTNIEAVIVRLDNGVDVNGERHVVRRLGEGKAWWE